MGSASPVSVFPRFIALKNVDLGLYVSSQRPDGMLAFDTASITRLATHEVLYNSDDPEASFIIRSQNQHFWQRSWASPTRPVCADRDPSSPPSATETWARFKLVTLDSGKFALRSAAPDGFYLKWTSIAGVSHAYAALSATPDLFTAVEVVDAWETAFSIPRYIHIKGDNDEFLHTVSKQWLKFDSTDHGDLSDISEVIPLVDGSVIIYSPKVQLFWRIEEEWIWPFASHSTALADVLCHFEPVRLGTALLALRNRLNGNFCNRVLNTLSAGSSNSTTDRTTHLRISEAVNGKFVFDVSYLTGLASTTAQTPIAVAYGSVVNNSSFTTDLTVTATQKNEVQTSYTFTNSFTFTQSISTEFRAGIPFLASGKIEVEIGFEQSFSNEWNTTTTKILEFATSFLVKDVPPGGQASVEVICSTARMRIPFMYRIRETAPNGIDRPSELRIDGIFEGVDAYKTEAIISNGVSTIVTPMTPFPTLSAALNTAT